MSILPLLSARQMTYDRRAKEDKIPGGLGDSKSPLDFDPEQVSKGIEVELEHTDDPSLAQEIAIDHLTEDPKYYDKLETIEKHSYDRRRR